MTGAPHSRAAQNRRRAVVLLAGATGVFLPFATGVSYGLVRAAEYLLHSGEPAPTPLPMVAALSLLAAAILPLVFFRLTASPLRLLSFCGPLSFRTPAQDARELLEDLAARSDLPPPRLYVLETPWPNALSAGKDPAQAIVVVTRGLLQLLERRELEAVLAHELSHIGHQDTRWNTVVTAIAVFVHLPFQLLAPARAGSARGSETVPRWFALAAMPIAPAILLATAPLVVLVRALAPRRRELLADADAIELTGWPEGLITALAKIWGAGSQMPKSDPAVGHLFFANPKPRQAAAFHVRPFNPHLAFEERIGALSHSGGGIAEERIDAAIDAGQEFADRRLRSVDRELEAEDCQPSDTVFLNEGSRASNAQRIVGPASDVYEADNARSSVIAHVAPGDLVIVFQQAGPFQQIVTAGGAFGFLPRSIKLEKTDRLAPDVFLQAGEKSPEPSPAKPPVSVSLTVKQLTVVTAFGLVVFLGVLFLQAVVH